MKINKYLFLVLLFIGFILLGNLLFLVTSYFTGIPLEVLTLKETAYNKTSLIILKFLIGFNHLISFTITSLVYVCWYKKQNVSDFFNIKNQPQIGWMISCFLLLMISYPLIGYTTMLGEWIDLPDWAKMMDESSMDQLKTILKMDNPFELILNLVVIALLPGLGEELLFRGIIQKELSTSMSSPHLAIWTTAIIFSAFHLQIEGFLPKMILGLLFGYIYHYTKNLWYPILLHAINNGMQVLIVYFSGEAFAEATEMNGPEIHWAIALVSLVIMIGVWYNADKRKLT